MIGEEGDVDLSTVDQSFLVEGFDQSVIDHYEGKISDRLRNATLEELTVWVDPLDGTQVGKKNILKFFRRCCNKRAGSKCQTQLTKL